MIGCGNDGVVANVGWLRSYCSMMDGPGRELAEAYLEVSKFRSGSGDRTPADRTVDFAAHVDFGKGEMTVLRGSPSYYCRNSFGKRFAFLASEIRVLYRDGKRARRVKSRRFGPGPMDGWTSREELVVRALAETGTEPVVVPAY